MAVISCHSFIALTEEMEQAQLIERYACWTDRRYLLRVVPANDQTYVDFDRLLPEPESAEEREARRDIAGRPSQGPTITVSISSSP